jgi:hypothetical protein
MKWRGKKKGHNDPLELLGEILTLLFKVMLFKNETFLLENELSF